MKCAPLFVSVMHQICAGCGEGALSCGINSCQQTFGSGSLDTPWSPPAMPSPGTREDGMVPTQGMCWAWMSPTRRRQAWLPQWVPRGMGLLSSSQAKAVRVPLCLVPAEGQLLPSRRGAAAGGTPFDR